jgi:thioester reductase-like protein
MSGMVEFNKGKDISHLQNLRPIITAGADISRTAENWCRSNGIKLCIGYGLTESPLTMASNDGPTKEFSTDVYPCRFDANGKPYCHFEDFGSNIKHLCLRGDLPSLAQVKLRSDGYYETGDLFKQFNKGGYHYLGRKDDTIVLSNGEKTNPAPMEQIINTCPVVKHSIVVGRGRQCIALLVILNDTAIQNMSENDITKQIMEVINKANKVSPSHSAIVQQMIKTLPSDTVLPFTPKGTLKRREVEEMFDEILSKLYDDFYEGPSRSSKKAKLNHTSCNKQDLVQFLLEGAAEILNLRIEDIEVDRSLFDLGLNSLKSNQLRNYISTRFNVDTNFIYHHSTISSICHGITDTEQDVIEKSYDQTQHLLEIYLDRAEKEFSRATSPQVHKTSHVVLLTGTTGSLGAFILCQLLKDANVKKVYCVIRGDPNQMWTRLQKSFRDRSLDVSLLSDKVKVIALNFMDKHFGLDQTQFTHLKQEITMVQHCGWLLDFNMPIDHFNKECIAPFYNLLAFSLARPDPIPVHFVSSVSASALMDPIKIQEVSPPINARVALPMGYGQSKLVVEVVMDFLATKKLLPCFIHRVGQMYGDTVSGVWNYSEQFPLMFIGGGSFMGVMPELDRSVNWLPIDYAAKIIVEIMFQKEQNAQHIYHIVNPHALQWTDVLNILKSSGVAFTTVTLSEWIDMLENSPENPAMALISHYRAMLKGTGRTPKWDTVKTQSIAPTINRIPPLDCHLFKKFLKHWSSDQSWHI